MRGVYEAQVQITGLTAGRTGIYITAPSDRVVEIIEASVTPVGSNVTNQNIECCLQDIGTLGIPTATTLTPIPTEPGDQAAASTVKGSVTASEPTYAANTQVCKEGAPSLSGWRYQENVGTGKTIKAGASAGLRLLTASLTSGDFNFKLKFREIG